MAAGQHVGAAKPRAGGGLVVNLRDGIGLYGPDLAFSWLVRDPVPGRRGNDAAVAPDGALWAGTMRYDEEPGGGSLTRVAPDGTAVRALTAAVSNGTDWSPDGRLMYYVDSPTRGIDVFDFDGREAVNRRRLAEIETGAGFPDGLTVDADAVSGWRSGTARRSAGTRRTGGSTGSSHCPCAAPRPALSAAPACVTCTSPRPGPALPPRIRSPVRCWCFRERAGGCPRRRSPAEARLYERPRSLTNAVVRCVSY